jgi:uncharacterized membrane protein YkvA (DUF1232 family)
MPEIAEYVRHQAEKITPKLVESLLHKLPLLKVEFAQIHAPKFPHLVDQLSFLADFVEDFAEGADPTIPYVAAAEASFALIYAHKHVDLIPDTIPGLGRADDSSVVRAVLIRHEGPLSRYAVAHGVDWNQITLNP